MSLKVHFAAVFACLTFSLGGHAAIPITFDQARYDIDPGQTFQVGVVLTAPLAHGLSSYGLRMLANPLNSRVAAANLIQVPAALDFNGVAGPGAVRALSPGQASVKGTVDFASNPPVAFEGSILATFEVTDLAVSGSYPLNLAFFNTLGPTEQIFVDGSGAILDSEIVFGSALVNYRPTVALLHPTNGALFPVGAAISLTAEASDLDGIVAKVQFYDGTNLLGAALAPDFQYSWTNAPLGLHELSAVACDNLGATRTSAVVNVWVATAPPPSFVTGVNLGPNSPPVVIDGNQWLGYLAALNQGLSVSANVLGFNQGGPYPFPLVPATSPEVATLFRSKIFRWGGTVPGYARNGEGFSLRQPLPSGDYRVFLWMLENSAAHDRNMDVKLEGVTVATAVGDLPLGHWRKYGPYAAQVADGALDIQILRHSKGDPTLFGFEVHRPPAMPPPELLLRQSEGRMLILFPTRAGFRYLLECTDSLQPSLWRTLLTLEGNDSLQVFEPPVTAGKQCFYRLRLQ